MAENPDLNFDPDFASPAQWAAEYRRHGLQVVPGWMPGEPKSGSSKRPYLSEWKTLQNELVSDIVFLRWYDPTTGIHRNRQNMGIITGACSDRVFILDFDKHKPEALQWWYNVCRVHNNGMEPDTPHQQTGGGGQHWLFRAPLGWMAPTSAGAIGGVDIRGQAGFAVLPPSRHESGASYEWHLAPWEVAIAEAPDWLCGEVDKLFGAARPPHFTDNTTAKAAPEGEFDDFGTRTDGREPAMRDLIWAALVGFKMVAPMGPVGEAEKASVFADWVRGTAPQKPQPGESREQGLERENRGISLFNAKWQAALKKWDTGIAEAAKQRTAKEQAEQASSPPPQPDPAKPTAGFELKPFFPIDKKTIPLRDWVIPGLMLKKHVTIVVAPPGGGKSLLTLHWAIAIGAGVQWGGWAPRKPEKVLIINAEDDGDEMNRRIVMAAEVMKVDQAALVGQVFRPSDAVHTMVIAKFSNATKSVLRMPLIEEIVKTVKENNIGVIVVDPFAETIEVDENSNTQLKWAGVLWREVARRTGAALVLVHHTKKYSNAMAGDPDAGRGGGSMTGIARITCTLFNMTEDEAAAMNIPLEDRRKFIRFDDAKGNYHELDQVKWFEKRTALVGNSNGFLPDDSVGVLVPWAPPGPFDGVSVHDLNLVLDAIDRGVLDASDQPTGQLYSPTPKGPTGDRWVGKVLVRRLERSEEVAKAMLKKWFENDVLEVVDYTDPRQRKTRQGVRSVLANRPGKETYRDEA